MHYKVCGEACARLKRTKRARDRDSFPRFRPSHSVDLFITCWHSRVCKCVRAPVYSICCTLYENIDENSKANDVKKKSNLVQKFHEFSMIRYDIVINQCRMKRQLIQNKWEEEKNGSSLMSLCVSITHAQQPVCWRNQYTAWQRLTFTLDEFTQSHRIGLDPNW